MGGRRRIGSDRIGSSEDGVIVARPGRVSPLERHRRACARARARALREVIFVGEEGVDEGGVQKEFMQVGHHRGRKNGESNWSVMSCHVRSWNRTVEDARRRSSFVQVVTREKNLRDPS